MPGLFIDIEVDESLAGDAQIAAKLAEVCPVDIYGCSEDGTLRLIEQNLDECVLCELCIHATPPGTVKVIKLYSGETLPAEVQPHERC